MPEDRLIELETRIAHHELAIEALQLETYDQQKAIAKLEATVELLVKQLRGMVGDGLEIGPANEKPPHY